MEYKGGEDYLNKHGIDKDYALLVFGLKFGDKGVSFELKDSSGNFLGKKTRFLEGETKYKMPVGFDAHKHLFNGNGISGEEWVVYCEGEMDCIKLNQEGIPAVSGMAGVGKVPTDIEVLRDRTVYVCLDNDEAGTKNIEKTVQSLEVVAKEVRVVRLPDTAKDVCEFFALGKTAEDFIKLKDSSYEINPVKIMGIEEFVGIEFPKAQWLVRNLIRADGLNLVVGQSGVGKSLLCLSLIKAVASGTFWLQPEFITTPKKVLIIDKENSDIDLQNNLKDMGVQGDVRIFITAELFDFVDNKLVLTPAANKLKRYIENNEIDVILLDSMIDFYVGSEDSSTDFNFNYQTWRKVFGDKCILTIHHENKQPVKGKRNAKDRARGSSNIVAQANSIISISSEETSPQLITVEHTKVRGAKKHQMFQIEMKTGTEYITNRSKVTGFEWKGVIDIRKKAAEGAREAILGFLALSPETYYKASEISDAICSDDLGEQAISKDAFGKEMAKMRGEMSLDSKGKGGKHDPFLYRYPHSKIGEILSVLSDNSKTE